MRILITNDDGIQAEGLIALKRALDPLGEVFVVAPDRPRSATGHAITLHKPLRLHLIRLTNGSTGYASNGTPTDCVTLGLYVVMGGKADLVVAGINEGPNLGWDLTYSGTVAAAIEGAIQGFPAFAISMVAEESEEIASGEATETTPPSPTLLFYETAMQTAYHIAQTLAKHRLPKRTFLNVNVPNVPPDQVRGYQVTALGRRHYADRLEPRQDPGGRTYYWLSGSLIEDRDQPGTDVHAVLHRYISITPVHLDLTAHDLIEPMQEWFDG